MSILVFRVGDVRPLWEHAKAATAWQPTFAQSLSDEELRELDEDPTEREPLGPGLHWVKDRGTYLLSNGIPRQMDPNDPEKCHVVYAEGLGPDASYWDLRNACGGDDFVELLDASICNLMDGVSDDAEMLIQVKRDSFQVGFREPKKEEV